MTNATNGRLVSVLYLLSVVVALWAFTRDPQFVLVYGVASWFGGVFFDRLFVRAVARYRGGS